MDSFHGYDTDMVCAPEDRRGYREPEPAFTQAERLIDSAKLAAAHLAGIPSAEVGIGLELRESTVLEIAQRTGTKVSTQLFAPHPFCGTGTHLLYSFEFRAHGVRIRGQGSRPATAAEIAAGVKP